MLVRTRRSSYRLTLTVTLTLTRTANPIPNPRLGGKRANPGANPDSNPNPDPSPNPSPRPNQARPLGPWAGRAIWLASRDPVEVDAGAIGVELAGRDAERLARRRARIACELWPCS